MYVYVYVFVCACVSERKMVVARGGEVERKKRLVRSFLFIQKVFI